MSASVFEARVSPAPPRWLHLPRRVPVVPATLLILLTAASLAVRWPLLDAGLWVDDAQAVGIAAHGLADLPSMLHQDGAPPLYYALLSVWMHAFGQGEVAVCLLALCTATAAVGAGMWAGTSLFGVRAGLFCAAGMAFDPLLTLMAGQARMYSLVSLLSLLVTTFFVRLFVRREQRFLAPFAVTLALLCYTHYWGLFYGIGLAVAAGWLIERATYRRGMIRDGVLAFGGAALLFVPWLPTLAYQVGHTGAPWSITPDINALTAVGATVFGCSVFAPAALAAGAGAARIVRRGDAEYHVLLALLLAAVATVTLAWAVSQASPNWASRYFAVVTPPLLLAFSLALARAGRLGIVAFLLLIPTWTALTPSSNDYKSNARRVLAAAAPSMRPGDLVLSTQPEQLPVLAYYLPSGLRYLSTAGPVADPTAFDWRNGTQRMETSYVATALRSELDRLPPGGRVLVAAPPVGAAYAGEPEWPALVRRRTLEWIGALSSDDRFVPVKRSSVAQDRALYSALGVGLYEKVRP